MMDDVLVHGRTQEEQDERLTLVLSRLQAAGITLNQEKCKFSQTSVRFLGHVVDHTGIQPGPEKIPAITHVHTPKNAGDVRRFLGMINQLSKISPNLAEETQSLRELLSKERAWVWGEPQELAFCRLKKILTNAPVLAHFDPNRETIVSADASSYGLGAVLLQKQENGEFQPVAFISRSMTPTEQRYAQIEKEALAFTWACERLTDYLMGLTFHVQTDHKPLVPLFTTKHLEELPLRVQRFRLRMTRFNFSMSHVPGKHLLIADALSRSPNAEAEATNVLPEEIQVFVDAVLAAIPATEERIEQIRQAQQKDRVPETVGGRADRMASKADTASSTEAVSFCGRRDHNGQ